MATKDSGLRIRVDRPLREAFLEACRTQDKPAAQVIREFMRDYISRQDAKNYAAPSGEWKGRSQPGGK